MFLFLAMIEENLNKDIDGFLTAMWLWNDGQLLKKYIELRDTADWGSMDTYEYQLSRKKLNAMMTEIKGRGILKFDTAKILALIEKEAGAGK